MFTWRDVEVERQRREDETDRAAAHRFAKEHTLRPEATPMKRHQRFLVFLGAQLVAWGCRLQERYETLVLTTPAGDEPFIRPATDASCACNG